MRKHNPQQLQLFQLISAMDTPQLLHGFTNILDELILRDVLRSLNNPTGDYADWLAATRLGLQFHHHSHVRNMGTDEAGHRYLIKARRLTRSNKSRQLSLIRYADQAAIDFLIAILFDHHFRVLEAWQIPQPLIAEYGRPSEKAGGVYLTAGGKLLQDRRVMDIREKLRVG